MTLASCRQFEIANQKAIDVGEYIATQDQKRQEKIIKEFNPNYTVGDWVLWILPEISLHQDQAKEITGEIHIYKENGEEISIEQCTRRPCANKAIYYCAMKADGQRAFGFPLVFKTYMEVCEVKKIVVDWDIFTNYYLGETPFDLQYTQYVVEINLNFEKEVYKNTPLRFITIRTRDDYDIKTSAIKKRSECKNIYHYRGYIEKLPEDYTNTLFCELIEGEYWQKDKCYPIQKTRFYDFEKQLIKGSKPYEKFIKYTKNTVIKNEIQWEIFWIHKDYNPSIKHMASISNLP